ncbi:hypothetical protein [Nannocystis sp. SCPEA4]|uniref:hypothetical protein n=1 Tax=Nannocystis sp. SCPEA4 TaxID=2996787 RepID=UPI00226E89B9|nr:hypothetical protein [Nannocystis sp. SCPEA4]MCY1056264.1 hypothetical protein [Nannocystis sp. SCPEA4]
MIALCGAPQLARADAFIPPTGKSAVGVTIAVENLGDYPQYLFVLWPDGCLHNEESLATYTILNLAEDDGRSNLLAEGCVTQRLFAFPGDTYVAAGGALPEAARRQLGDEPPTDPRVLVRTIEAEPLWWVPIDVYLYGIEDVYRVGIDAGGLTLTPTRVRFDFGDDRILDKAFNKGRRPRLPRARDIPPAPPPEATKPAVEAPPTPAAVEAKAPDLEAQPPTHAPAPDESAPATPPAPAESPPPATDAGEISTEPWPPPQLVYGGLCLLVALGAGFALRRR